MQLWCLKRQGRRLRAVGCMSYSRGGTVTGRLEAGQLNMLRVCCCCRLAGVTPANSIGLDSTVFFVRESWWYNKCTDLLNNVLQPWSTVGSPVS